MRPMWDFLKKFAANIRGVDSRYAESLGSQESIAHGDIIKRQPAEGIRAIITDKIPLDDNVGSNGVLGKRNSDSAPIIIKNIHIDWYLVPQRSQIGGSQNAYACCIAKAISVPEYLKR